MRWFLLPLLVACSSNSPSPAPSGEESAGASEVAPAAPEPLQCVVRTDTSSEDLMGSEVTWRRDAQGRWVERQQISDGPVMGSRWRYEDDGTLVVQDVESEELTRVTVARAPAQITITRASELSTRVATLALDAQGRPTNHVLHEDGEALTEERCHWDDAGRLVRLETLSDPGGHVHRHTDYTYDAEGRVLTMEGGGVGPYSARVTQRTDAAVVVELRTQDEYEGELTFTTTFEGPCRVFAEPRCPIGNDLPPGLI